MKKSAAMKGLFATLGLIVLILDTKTAFKGATEGVASCISTVIPSLFPFILLSCWLNDSVAGESDRMPERIMKSAGLPKGSGPILISALLGGYPSGAQAVYRAYCNGRFGKKDAERVLAYTNNAGPAFIFGMAGHIFPSRAAPWFLWGIHILSAWMVRLIIGASGGTKDKDIPPSAHKTDIIMTTSKIMCTICAWVITFRIIVSYLEVLLEPWVPSSTKTVLFGSLELVNGCCSLPEVIDVRSRFVILSGLLAFGGVCVMMQTISVVRELSTGYYLAGKLLQTVFSIIIATALAYQKWYLMAVFLVPVIVLVIRSKNNGRNPVAIRV